MEPADYHLRCELRGHDEDVRGVLACEIGIATSSRDKTIKTWVEDSANSYSISTTMVGHTDYVGPLAYLPPGLMAHLPHGALVSGSRDTTVIIWDPASGAALRTCKGHAYQVTAVAVLPTGEVVSASLDKTVRVWQPSDGSCTAVLEGHEGAVLSLAVTPSGDILSGSGDTSIKLWAGGKCTATLKGHTDTVRALAIFPGLGFVSGSHDMTLRVWDMQGNTLAELLGHTAIIYNVAVLSAPNLIASGSEDNTSRIWRPSGECLQVLEHPGCVWDCCFTAAGDLVTACSDSVARVWSMDPARKASDEVVAKMRGQLEQLKAAAAEAKKEEQGAGATGLPPGIKVVDAHTLLQPGGKDGETKVVKEANGAVNAYSWDASAFKWELIGEVVAAPQGGAMSGGKKLYQGREWDFVFDVDVEEGAPARKLPYNREENPYIAADRFLEAEGLPAYFKEQVVQFILQNSGQGQAPMSMAPGASITGGFCDPFTGGGGGGSAPAPRPAQQSFASPAAFSVTGGGVDPFTGGAGTGAASAAGAYEKGRLIHTPARVFMAFDNVPNGEAVGRKLREFNSVLQQQGSGLSVEAMGPVDGLLQKMPAAASAAGAGFAPAELALLLQQLLCWPREQLFPALDVARMVALDASAAAAMAADPGSLAKCLSAAASAPAVPANQQLGLRLACNCFKHAPLRAWVVAARGELLDAFSSCCSSSNKAVRLSFVTLLYNYAVHCKLSAPSDSETKLQALSALVELLGGIPMEDGDSVFRALVALGTLCHEDAETSGLAKDLGVQDILRKVNESPEAKTPAGRRLLEAALDVMTLLSK